MKVAFYASAWVGLAAIIGLMLVVPTAEAPVGAKGDPVTEEKATTTPIKETYFAKIKEDGTVETVIVADQSFIDSGVVGDPSMWRETKYDGSESGAVIGGKLSTTTNTFWTKEQVKAGTTTESVISKGIATST